MNWSYNILTGNKNIALTVKSRTWRNTVRIRCEYNCSNTYDERNNPYIKKVYLLVP